MPPVHDYVISNGTGAAVRSDLNGALAAIVSNNSSASEPSPTYAYMWWADTTTGLLKQRNSANAAWITIGTLASTNLGLLSLAGGTLTGALLADDSGTVALPAIAFDGDTNTGIFRAGADQLGIATNGVERVEFGNTEVVFNDDGADVDFRVEGDTNANLFKIDAGLDEVQVANLNGGPLAGTRNRIINGDMRIDQRNAGAAVTVNLLGQVFATDRWYGFGQSSDGVFTLQRDTDAPSGFQNSLKATVTTADASVGATQGYGIVCRIEGFNTADLGWGTANAQSVMLSFWVRSSLTGSFGAVVKNSAANRTYPFSYTISAANTWEQKTVVIPGDTTGTWLTNNGVGFSLQFSIGAGSSIQGTANAWAATNYNSASGTINVISTNGATFYITGVQLEPGTVATPFERRSYGQELALCQRYYETGNGDCVTYASSAAAIQRFAQNFVVLKRATATVAISKISGNATSVSVSSVFANLNGFSYGISSTNSSQTLQSYWTASAEL